MKLWWKKIRWWFKVMLMSDLDFLDWYFEKYAAQLAEECDFDIAARWRELRQEMELEKELRSL